MEQKRTPGDWFVAHDSRGYAVETERVRIVNLGHSDECAEADARLMAAAPDLLAALQELRYACTDKAEAMADAAIAKALGHNVELTGAARLDRAASSDRRERGRAQG